MRACDPKNGHNSHLGPKIMLELQKDKAQVCKLLKIWYLLWFQKESNLHYMRCKLKLLDKWKKTEVGSWYSQYFLLLVFLNNNFIPSGTCFSSKMMKIVELKCLCFSHQRRVSNILRSIMISIPPFSDFIRFKNTSSISSLYEKMYNCI